MLKGWSLLNVGFVIDGQYALVVFQQFCFSHILNSVCLFIYLLLLNGLVISVGYYLVGQTQNTPCSFARFEVYTVVLLKIQLFWDVMLCQLVNSHHFRGVIAVM